jgi:hypothetical protein
MAFATAALTFDLIRCTLAGIRWKRLGWEISIGMSVPEIVPASCQERLREPTAAKYADRGSS